MRKPILELAAAIVLTLAAILASATGAKASDVMVMNAFARASATPAAETGVAYFTVMNHGAAADRLLAVASPASQSASIHESRMDGDVMKMVPVEALVLDPQATVEFKPGSFHIMLMGLKAPLKEGDTILLSLTFEKAGVVTVDVPVGSAAAVSHDHGTSDSGG